MLHRGLQENPIYKNSKALHCWIECLLRANHSNDSYYLGRKKIQLKVGEFVLGRYEFGKSIGISGSTAWFWLKRFEVDNMLNIKKTSRGCLCKVKNWENYQAVDNTVDNKKTTNEQQMNTDNNDNNVNNEKNNILSADNEVIIPNLLQDNQEHIRIIGIYATAKNNRFQNIEQQRSFIRRNLRPAMNLKGYPMDQIRNTINYLVETADFKWTLESVGKFIDEDLNNLNNNKIPSI